MVYLSILSAKKNRIVSISVGLFELINLNKLILSHNQLREISDSFDKLVSLNTLEIDHNLLNHIPKNLTLLLKEGFQLNIRGNPL